MGVLEVVLSAVVCAVIVVSVGRIAAKAGYSPAWAVVPAAVAGVTYGVVAEVHRHARFGALSLHMVFHSARALLIADAACVGVMVVLLAVFAFADWPALTALAPAAATSNGSTSATATSMSKARRRRNESSARARAAAAAVAQAPARMRIRALPDVTGQPAGWFASGALGSGEQSYWDGTQWTARRCWRNEMWINQPLEEPSSLLAQPMR